MKLTIALIGIALVLSACSDAKNANVTTTVAQNSPTVTSVGIPESDPATVLDTAIDQLTDAGSYSFEAEVKLSVNGESVESELDGWVDGSDRELTLTIGDQRVVTRVIDGAATIERDSSVTPVEVSEAAEAPSIEVLRNVRGLEIQPNGTLAGSLNAADLGDGGFDVNGSGNIELTIAPDGSLAGYEITGNNGAWSIEVGFDQLGAVFSP